MATNIVKAISDETRFKLMERISRNEICACELPRFVGKTQPAVSQHLKVLLQAGLVKMRRDGAKRLYSVSEKGRKVLADISRW
jgi:DNA-binding transcriptional ArsR family regulator